MFKKHNRLLLLIQQLLLLLLVTLSLVQAVFANSGEHKGNEKQNGHLRYGPSLCSIFSNKHMIHYFNLTYERRRVRFFLSELNSGVVPEYSTAAGYTKEYFKRIIGGNFTFEFCLKDLPHKVAMHTPFQVCENHQNNSDHFYVEHSFESNKLRHEPLDWDHNMLMIKFCDERSYKETIFGKSENETDYNSNINHKRQCIIKTNIPDCGEDCLYVVYSSYYNKSSSFGSGKVDLPFLSCYFTSKLQNISLYGVESDYGVACVSAVKNMGISSQNYFYSIHSYKLSGEGPVRKDFIEAKDYSVLLYRLEDSGFTFNHTSVGSVLPSTHPSYPDETYTVSILTKNIHIIKHDEFGKNTSMLANLGFVLTNKESRSKLVKPYRECRNFSITYRPGDDVERLLLNFYCGKSFIRSKPEYVYFKVQPRMTEFPSYDDIVVDSCEYWRC